MLALLLNKLSDTGKVFILSEPEFSYSYKRDRTTYSQIVVTNVMYTKWPTLNIFTG